GATQCGAGISKGQNLNFTLVYNNGSPAITAEDTTFASDAKQAGIIVTLVGKSFNFILQNYYDIAAPANINTGGTFNIGDFSDSKADSLIHNSVFGSDPQAVNKEAAYIAEVLPGLF